MMSETQDPGGGALDSHPFGAGFGPSSGKDHHFSPTSTSNGNGLTDLSGDTHLTLLKSSSGLGSYSSFDSDGLSRLSSDGYMEMRYIQLGDWGDLTGFTAEGLSARLIDSRSLNDSPDNVIQYRPWEKPDPSLASPMNSQPTTTSSPSGHVFVTTNGNGIPTTSNGKSPTTLTTLTNAFPAFSDAFGPNGQKLPSFQSQFNSFNEPSMHHHHQPPPHHHGNGNGDILHSPVPVTTTSSPGPGAPSLPSFHTIPANRGYIHPGHGPPTLVTTSQGQPQFLDERHIQIFPGQIITATPVTSAQHHQGLNGNGHHFVTSNQLVMNGHPGANGPHQPHFITGNGTGPQQFLELVPVSPMQLHGHYPPPPHPHHPQHAKLQPQTTDGNIPSLNLNDLHHTHHNSNMNLNNLNVPPPAVPTTKYLTNDGHLDTLIAVKLQPGGGLPFDPHGHHRLHHHHPNLSKMDPGSNQQQNSPQIVTNSSANTNGNGQPHGHQLGASPAAKKSQKRKRSTMENSMENNYNINSHNHHFNNNNSHDLNDPQVSSVSSTDSDFKRPPNMGGLNGGLEHGTPHIVSLDGSDLEKPVKKKRKRCGECTGCQRKDNCGDCAPCRNEKSHQICKVRRCEKLTEKKSRAGRVAGLAAAMK